MSKIQLVMCASILAIVTAGAAPAAALQGDKPVAITAWEASRTVTANDKMSTGTARARDRLDSATSTSSIPENEITKLAPTTLAELFRNIPGVRVEAGAGDTDNGYTVRGLPLVAEGSKYLQIQEDGLPVVEFGDLLGQQPDNFTRFDLNIGQVESIRGGSASTFASNAPGGVVNLISKTGEVEGGSVMATTGLSYRSYRLDADYGGHLSDTLRFHVGGFYRQGTGPRETGFTGVRGGQIKVNVTKEFANGYIRIYGKYLDDHTPMFFPVPVAVTGTNADPKYAVLPGFSAPNQSLYSPNNSDLTVVDSSRHVNTFHYRDGVSSKVKSVGFETQFDVAGWTVSDRFRYADMTSTSVFNYTAIVGSPVLLSNVLGIPGAAYTYASGPLAGKAFDATRGNGLLAVALGIVNAAPNLDDVTNDVRASRVWQLGGGDLTTTAGFYAADQKLKRQNNIATIIQDVVGGGQSSLINVAAGGGAFPISQDGYAIFSPPGNGGNAQDIDVRYKILAPYGSLNFHRGKIAIGGSLRYDTGDVNGTAGRSLGASSLACVDVNGDGRTGAAECGTSIFPASAYRPIDYTYHYLSYSAGINYRVSQPLALFARYSKGARAAAEAILFSPALDSTGRLIDRSASYDPAKQAEAGLKYRDKGVTFNVTVFRATTSETNTQANRDANGNLVLGSVSRSYKAYGAELEGGVRRGPFSVTASATYAHAEIAGSPDPTLIGNTPRHQPKLIYQVTPQLDLDHFSLGANVVGVTRSYASDANKLRLPAYTTVGLFVQFVPIDKLVLSINASNIFNRLAITETLDDAVPPSGVVLARRFTGARSPPPPGSSFSIETGRFEYGRGVARASASRCPSVHRVARGSPS